MTREEARIRLLRFLEPRITVFTIVRRGSDHGKFVSLFYILNMHPVDEPATVIPLDGMVAVLLGRRCKDMDGVYVRGVGLNHARDLVESLSWELFKDNSALRFCSLD